MYSETFRTFFSTHRFVINSLIKMLYAGADPGFCVRGDESRREVWEPLKVSSGSRADP